MPRESAQSVLEYAVVAGIVVLAVIFGGPVLVRSINAHFKMMDNNVQDAFQENIRQAQAPSTASACQCVPAAEDPEEWPAGNCTVGGCSSTEKYHYRRCTPLKCRKEAACVPDEDCCTDISPQSCGTLLLNPQHADKAQYNCAGRGEVHALFSSVGGVKGACIKEDGTVTRDCAVGERIIKGTCGVKNPGADGMTTKDFYACRPDNDCRPDCSPMYAEGDSRECSLASLDRNLMDEEVDWRLGPPPVNTDNPARHLTKFTAGDDPKMVDAYKLYTAFVSHVGACNKPFVRSCERYCTSCTIPSPDGTACVKWNCQANAGSAPYRGVPKEAWIIPPASDVRNRLYKITVFADPLDFVAACFDKDGNVFEQKGNRKLAPCPAGDAGYIGRDINGKSYCYGNRNPSARYAYGQVSCQGVIGYVRVWAGNDIESGEAATANTGYQICGQDFPDPPAATP